MRRCSLLCVTHGEVIRLSLFFLSFALSYILLRVYYFPEGYVVARFSLGVQSV